MKLITTGTPDWFSKVAIEIERNFVSRLPKIPVRLPFYISTALPRADQYRGCIIWVDDISLTATSNGNDWITSEGNTL